MKNSRLIQQENLLESVLEVSDILKQQHFELDASIITIIAAVQALLVKDSLSSDDLEWIDKKIKFLCHFKCLYDICPLELLQGETEQERWQRWRKILEQMRAKADLLCSSK